MDTAPRADLTTGHGLNPGAQVGQGQGKESGDLGGICGKSEEPLDAMNPGNLARVHAAGLGGPRESRPSPLLPMPRLEGFSGVKHGVQRPFRGTLPCPVFLGHVLVKRSGQELGQ